MNITTGFYQWHSTTRYNHRIIPLKFIYLRYTVVLICGVYKYTTVDIDTPYRRFRCIVVVIFVVVYVLFSTDFFICIYLYVYVHGILPIDTYISHPFFIHICVHILIHIFIFSRHYILTAHMFATTCETACNQRADVRFNIFKIFD